MNDDKENNSSNISEKITREKAQAAFHSMRQKASAKGFMTEEEIDAEIQAARNEEDPCSNLSVIAESLFGSIPDTLTLEESRKERLKEKYGL